MDCSSTDRVKLAGTVAGEKVSAILDTISRASASTIRSLEATVDPLSLDRAVSLLGGAGSICLVGLGDALPAAALLAGGLGERGRVCKVFGPSVGDEEHEISLLGPDDLLILIKTPTDDSPAIILAGARSCKVPVLTIAEPGACAESGRRDVALPVPPAEVYETPVLAGHMAMAQLLLIALDRHRLTAD